MAKTDVHLECAATVIRGVGRLPAPARPRALDLVIHRKEVVLACPG